MRWLFISIIGIMSGIVGAVLSAFGADVATRAHNVSDFEGARGYLIAFIFIPLGFLCGLAVGIVLARLSTQTDFLGFAKQLGLSILITAGVVGAVTGLSYLAADRPPTIDGKQLVLEFEIRLPLNQALPEDSSTSDFRVSLYASNSDNRYAEVRLDAAEKRDGRWVIPGTAGLYSHSARRSLLVSLGIEPSQVFDLRLSPTPRKEDEAWTDWLRPGQRADLSAIPSDQMIELRYRVQPIQP